MATKHHCVMKIKSSTFSLDFKPLSSTIWWWHHIGSENSPQVKYWKDSTISCHHQDLRAIFTNNTDHYGLKWREDHVRQFVGGGVLVIRNPYNAIISFWNFEQTRTHTVFAARKSFCSLEFREFAFRSILRWYELHEDWLSLGRDLHVVLYEDLVRAPLAEIRRITDHLNIPIDPPRLACLERHLGGSHHRSGSLDVNPYNTDHLALMATLLERTNETYYGRLNRYLPSFTFDLSKPKCPN